MREIMDTEKARQGHTGDGGRYVLGISLGGAAVALVTALVLL